MSLQSVANESKYLHWSSAATMKPIVIFFLTYLGIALGKIPGLAIDRVGVALLGAIAMISFGVVTPECAVQSIDLPTILLLYSLMIISAQLRLGGFYTWFALKTVSLLSRPKLFLLASMLAGAVLSAILANDIVCFAFTPVLSLSLIESKLNPLPFLIGLAVASNIGSAATIIGNPQNMLIGQVGRLDFMDFFVWCGPPSFLALFAGYCIILWIYRKDLYARVEIARPLRDQSWQKFNLWQTTKGIAATATLIALFFSRFPREISAIGIAGVLLCSRKMRTRDILGLVDWHLLTLFCALFIIIHGISQGDHLKIAMSHLDKMGLDLHNLYILTGLSAAISNIVSNVPATMLLVSFLHAENQVQWYTLAVSSTYAGNLFLLGSIANLIVVEQASNFGIHIDFRRHAVIGIPVTLLSLLILMIWIRVTRL
jgi:Na+/H+ antiporter NhaD/arsenite permease-like protein